MTNDNDSDGASFAERHAAVNPDPLEELRRRRQWWATCPNADGNALKPDAQIVPLETVIAAITELEAWRATGARILIDAEYLTPDGKMKLLQKVGFKTL